MAASTATEISNFLTDATNKKDVSSLERAHRLLQQLQMESAMSNPLNEAPGTHVAPDLHLFCCEAAIGLGKWDIAKKCIIPVLETGVSTKANEVRAAYCRGLIEASESSHLRCDQLVQRVVDSLAKVVQGMRTALRDPSKLAQLVVIGTQHLWNICQPLFRDGTFHTVVTVIGFAIFCLETIDYSNVVSRAGWMLRYAVALNGAGRYAEATAYSIKTAEFIARYCPQLRHTAYKVQIAMCKQCPTPKAKEAAKGVAKHVYTAQAFLVGITDPSVATDEILASWEEMLVDSAAMLEAGKEQAGDKAAVKAKGAPTPRGKKSGQGPAVLSEVERSEELLQFDEAMGDIGLCLAILGQDDKALQCSGLLANSRSLQARVYSEYISAWVAASKCGGFATQNAVHLGALSPSIEGELINIVRKIERSLQSAIRVNNPQQRTHAVQHGVIMMWNIALPLLQSKQRAQISRSLNVAVKLLDDVQSNLNELRALLHYEGSLSDIDSDYLGKAASRLDKALGIDYRVSPASSKLHGTDRPWDRFLAWTRRSIEMKANLYQVPNNPVDEALLIVEQSKDATVNNRVSMLTKAEAILSRSDPGEGYLPEEGEETVQHQSIPAIASSPQRAISPPNSPARAGKSTPTGKKRPGTAGAANDSAPRDVAMEERRHHLLHRSQLWHLILTYGWREKSPIAIDVCRSAANALLARTWTRRGDRDVLVLQADAHLKLAEMRMAELSQSKLHVAQLRVTDDNLTSEEIASRQRFNSNANNDSAIEGRLRFVAETTAAVQGHIKAVIDIATRLIRHGYPDQWLLLNAGIFLWNAFLPSFQENNYMGAQEALQAITSSLTDAENKIDPQSETQLYQDLLLAHAKCLVQLFMVRKLAGANAPSTATVAEVVAINSFHDFSAQDPTSAFLVKAWETCDKAIHLLRTPMDAKEFIMLTATIRRFQGKPTDISQRSLPQEKLLILIDQLFHPTTTQEERPALIKMGLDLLAQDPNIELCARFAEKAMGSHNKVAARAAIIGNNLFDEGKLGWKQSEVLLLHRRPATATKKDPKEEAKNKKKSISDSTTEAKPEVVEAIPSPTPEDYQWFALLLLYKGCVTASLINPAVQDKTTQIEIRRQALSAISESINFSLKGSKSFANTHIMQCYRHFRNVAQDLAGDPVSRHFSFDHLRTALSPEALASCAPYSQAKANAVSLSDADVVAQLMLLLLKILCDNKRAEQGMAVMKTAIQLLPPAQHKPFWALDIQLRCEAGLPTTQTLLRVKEFSAEMQAQTYLALARHGKDKADQIYAYQQAIELLQGRPVERAELMLAMAQWALQANAPISLSDVRATIISAIDQACSDADETGTVGRIMGNISASMSAPVTSRQGPPSTAASHMDGARSTSRRSNRSQPPAILNVRQLFVSIQAYYLLAKIAPYTPATADGMLVDRRNCLQMLVHYVMQVWSTVAEAANTFNREAKAKWAAQEAKEAQLMRQQQAEVMALRDYQSPPQTTVPDKMDKRMSKAQAAAHAAATAAQQLANSAATTISNKVKPEFPDDVVLPATPQAWIGFQYPVALLKTTRIIDSPYAINSSSVENPEALIALLRDSIEEMASIGLESLTPPITALLGILLHAFFPAESDIRIQTLELEATVKAWDLCYRVGASAAVLPFSTVTMSPIPATEERAALAEDSALVQKHNASLTQRQSIADSAPVLIRPPNRSRHPIHYYWLSIAQMLLLEGRLGQVRELLDEAASHATAHRDHESLAKALYLEAQLAHLDGHFDESNDKLVQAFGDGVRTMRATGQFAVDLMQLRVRNSLALHNLDGAFAAEAELHQRLGSQLGHLRGLSLEVAQLLVPGLQTTATTQFIDLLIAYVKRQHCVSQAVPLKTRQPGCTEQITTVDEIIAAAQGVLKRARANSALSPHFLHSICLQEIEVEELKHTTSPQSLTHKQRKALLQGQGRILEEAIASLKSELGPGVEALDGATLSTHNSSQVALARLLEAQGLNITERVVLNNVLVDELRSSSFTTIEVPDMPGAPPGLRNEVIKFMRSTSKMREATKRRNQREAKRTQIEEQRKIRRAEKQLEVEMLREQQRQDVIAANSGQGNKRDGKGSRGGQKTTARRKSDAEHLPTEHFPDVDPNDKCGIESLRTSDDEGLGEDSQSDEEEEREAALTGVENPTEEIRLTFGNAQVLFSQAADIINGAATPVCDPSFQMAAAMRRVAEAEVIGMDQRAAIISGRDLPSLLHTPTLLRCWSLPVEPTRRIEVEDRPASLQRGKEEKKATGKATKEKENNVPLPITQTEVRLSPVQPSTQRMPFPNAPAVPAAQQAASILIDCASRAFALGDRAQLAIVLMELAQVAVLLHNVTLAGQALELSQAAAASHYLLTLWAEIGHPDTPEASLDRLVNFVSQTSPHLIASQHFLGMQKLLKHFSPMHMRLSLPDPSTLLSTTSPSPDPQGSPTTGHKGALVPDTAFITITCVPTDYHTETKLMAVLRRPGNQLDVRMIFVSTSHLEALIHKHLRLANARRLELQRGKAGSDGASAEMAYAAYVLEVSALFEALLSPFGAVLSQPGKVGASVCLALHPSLSSLPFESLPVFGRSKSVSRDISFVTHQQHLIRRSGDRYSPTNVQCMVDPYMENEDHSTRFVFGDAQPRAPFSNITTAVDSNRQLRPVQPHQVLRMLTQPSANTVLVSVGGKFTSACSLEDICGLQLDHIRAMFVFDNAVSSKASRRENECNMAKAQHVLRQEGAFWVLPLLLLARGVDYCVASSLPSSIPFVDSLANVVYNSVEKSVGLTDVLTTFAPRYHPPSAIPILDESGANASLPQPQSGTVDVPTQPTPLPPIPQQKPSSRPSSTAAKPTAAAIGLSVTLMESASLKFFGISPIDEANPAPLAKPLK